MAVSKRLRFEILRRDNHQCRYCGRCAPEVKLTVDHVVPETLGGTAAPGNLVAACADCNSGKSSVPADAPLVADVANDALRWAAAMRQVFQERAAARGQAQKYYKAFSKKWEGWTYEYAGEKCTVSRPDNWRLSIDQLLAAGLEIEDLVELVDVAMSARAKDTWRYWCGCCWKRLTAMQERAAEILAACDPIASGGLVIETCWTQEEINQTIANSIDIACRHTGDSAQEITACEHGSQCADTICRFYMSVFTAGRVYGEIGVRANG